jgi:hypothetical protein
MTRRHQSGLFIQRTAIPITITIIAVFFHSSQRIYSSTLEKRALTRSSSSSDPLNLHLFGQNFYFVLSGKNFARAIRLKDVAVSALGILVRVSIEIRRLLCVVESNVDLLP